MQRSHTANHYFYTVCVPRIRSFFHITEYLLPEVYEKLTQNHLCGIRFHKGLELLTHHHLGGIRKI
jgi:hypothetical protein